MSIELLTVLMLGATMVLLAIGLPFAFTTGLVACVFAWTLFGPAAKVREGVAAWRAAGVHTPILVPSSAAGNQMTAIDEVFAAFD